MSLAEEMARARAELAEEALSPEDKRKREQRRLVNEAYWESQQPTAGERMRLIAANIGEGASLGLSRPIARLMNEGAEARILPEAAARDVSQYDEESGKAFGGYGTLGLRAVGALAGPPGAAVTGLSAPWRAALQTGMGATSAVAGSERLADVPRNLVTGAALGLLPPAAMAAAPAIQGAVSRVRAPKAPSPPPAASGDMRMITDPRMALTWPERVRAALPSAIKKVIPGGLEAKAAVEAAQAAKSKGMGLPEFEPKGSTLPIELARPPTPRPVVDTPEAAPPLPAPRSDIPADVMAGITAPKPAPRAPVLSPEDVFPGTAGVSRAPPEVSGVPAAPPPMPIMSAPTEAGLKMGRQARAIAAKDAVIAREGGLPPKPRRPGFFDDKPKAPVPAAPAAAPPSHQEMVAQFSVMLDHLVAPEAYATAMRQMEASGVPRGAIEAAMQEVIYRRAQSIGLLGQ